MGQVVERIKIIRKSGIPWDVSFLDFWKGYYIG
jgi:hypothetical protein